MNFSSGRLSRREFFFGAGTALFAAGNLRAALAGTPDLRFGVLSDIHVTTPKSARRFEKALGYFKRRGVDAVMVAGDLSDWGLVSGLTYVKEAWDRVFKDSAVVPLFCTGNHEYRGWRYGHLTLAMHASGYSEAERMSKDGKAAAHWEAIFGEKLNPVSSRTVKGYEFVWGDWNGTAQLARWMEENGSRLEGEKPFFYFQHVPVGGTVSGGDAHGPGDDKVRPVLNRFPNCICFTGHTHRPFFDERSIWQGEFTAIAVPSLSYASVPKWHENGGGSSKGPQKQAMPRVPTRLTLCGSQGYVVNVYRNQVVVERMDVLEEEVGAPAWTIPLPACRGVAPYTTQARKGTEPVPEFPEGAELDVDIRITQNRSGESVAVMSCEFPTAVLPGGGRAADYEIRAVAKDRSGGCAKCFVSPAFAQLAKYEPPRQHFWFDAAELPQDKDYVIEVRARNCYGKASRPLVSETLHGCPGLAEIDPKL